MLNNAIQTRSISNKVEKCHTMWSNVVVTCGWEDLKKGDFYPKVRGSYGNNCSLSRKSIQV